MTDDLLDRPVGANGGLKIIATDIVKTDIIYFVQTDPFPEGPVHPGDLFAFVDKEKSCLKRLDYRIEFFLLSEKFIGPLLHKLLKPCGIVSEDLLEVHLFCDVTA